MTKFSKTFKNPNHGLRNPKLSLLVRNLAAFKLSAMPEVGFTDKDPLRTIAVNPLWKGELICELWVA